MEGIMTRFKKVIKIKGDIINEEMKECHPRELPLTSKYIEHWWFDAIRCVYEYEKQRGLVGRHLLMSDNRIESGLKLYREKHIEDITLTTDYGGDVLAHVSAETDDEQYIVVVKNFIPETLPQFSYQRENFISNLQIACSCSDHMLSRYKENASLCCKHISSVLWMLQLDGRFKNMPRIFITPEDRMVGYQKSDVEELEVDIRALPLIKFTQHINILLMKEYQGMQKPALAVSVHRVDNMTHREESKPQWLTYVESKDVERLITGISKAYTTMETSNGKTPDEIEGRLCTVLKIKPRMIEKVVERIVEKKVFVEQKKRHWWHIWGIGRQKK
jgi:hypothetical protein